MKKIIFLSAISLLLFVNLALAQDNSLPNPGLTPDSPFYFLKSWKESVQMFFTFGAENKAKQFLHLADVRLTEYQKMIEAGKTDIALKTLKKYEKQLDQAMTKIKEAEEKGATAELDTMRRDGRLKQQEILKGISEKMPEAVKKTVVEERQKQWINFLSEVKGKFPEAIPGPIESGTLPMELLLNCPLPSVPAPESCGVKWLISSVQNCPYFNCPSVGKTQAPPERLAEPPQQTESEKSIEPGGVCIQVITPATGPDGTCKEFPTPCEVPADWKKVDKCPSVSIPSAPLTPPKLSISSEPTPTEIRYYTCPDGTKVESGRCFAGGGCSILVSPERQCPQQTPPVSRGTECQTAGEIKYFKCADGTQIPWCMCGPEGSFAGAKNAWQCQYYPIGFTCQKQTVTPTPAPAQTEPGIACCVQGEVCKVFPIGDDYNKSMEQCRKEGWPTGASMCSPNPCQPFPLSTTNLTAPTADDVPCQTEQMKDYKCSDGTLIKWQCKCGLRTDGEETRHCVVNPVESCPASVSSAPLVISWIWTRYLTWVSHIFWATNKPATSWIEYGPTTAYGSETPPSYFSPNYNHNVVGLPGQQRHTTYHFRIIAEDAQGNKIVSDDYTFTTGL